MAPTLAQVSLRAGSPAPYFFLTPPVAPIGVAPATVFVEEAKPVLAADTLVPLAVVAGLALIGISLLN